MKRYVVTGIVARFNIGQKIQITKEQAAPRLHNLSLIDKKNQIFEVRNQVEFKAGEVVGFDGPVNKAMLHEMEEEGSEKAKKIQRDIKIKKLEKESAHQKEESDGGDGDMPPEPEGNEKESDLKNQSPNGKLAV